MANDVCRILGYKNPWDAIAKHVEDDEKDDLAIRDSIGRMQNTTIISEPGHYGLIFGGQAPGGQEVQAVGEARGFPFRGIGQEEHFFPITNGRDPCLWTL